MLIVVTVMKDLKKVDIEFTQIGIEFLGNPDVGKLHYVEDILLYFMELFGIDYKYNAYAKRGLSYYKGDGFEVECEELGAQKTNCRWWSLQRRCWMGNWTR